MERITKTQYLTKTVIAIAILITIVLIGLSSCSSLGRYKAYPIEGGDTVTVIHKEHDGHSPFNKGEPVNVKNGIIVYDSIGAKKYVILRLIN